ncbi:hypothetical protein GTW43_32660 [Streptomyces sp. SID5785]|uniref:hypothetical protein n=1 Tax=Streptomyces sp. SID5785 TaxID=2690309 RepID=UPI001361D642|nr:hypothetical protein [Streptomyces sp. SID5785]MZD09799.1 hypothetical protein [Streptomyces sp. SID5785]
MPEESTPDLLGTEMREVTFPDHSRGIILVQAGTPQDDAEAVAARMWSEGRRPVP